MLSGMREVGGGKGEIVRNDGGDVIVTTELFVRMWERVSERRGEGRKIGGVGGGVRGEVEVVSLREGEDGDLGGHGVS